MPPGYGHMTVEEVRAHFRKLLDARVKEIQDERAALGLGYLGKEAILAQDPFESAGDTFPTFGRNPRVACRDRDARPAILAALTASGRASRHGAASRRPPRDGQRRGRAQRV